MAGTTNKVPRLSRPGGQKAGQLFMRPCPNAGPEGRESGHPSLLGSPELSSGDAWV